MRPTCSSHDHPRAVLYMRQGACHCSDSIRHPRVKSGAPSLGAWVQWPWRLAAVHAPRSGTQVSATPLLHAPQVIGDKWDTYLDLLQADYTEK